MRWDATISATFPPKEGESGPIEFRTISHDTLNMGTLETNSTIAKNVY